MYALREGCNYLQIEEKLLSLYLAGLDIGSMNHSVKFIEGFVDSVVAVMDKKIREHLHAVDHVPCRTRLFAFAVNKITELHMMGDAIGIVIMTEEGELKAMFVNYLLVTKHYTCHAIMKEIFEESCVKKLRLTNAA